MGGHLPTKLSRVVCYRDCPDRSIALGCADHDSCPCTSDSAGITQTLKCSVNADRLLFQRNFSQLQRAKLSDTDACKERQQNAELACIHILQQVRNESGLLLTR